MPLAMAFELSQLSHGDGIGARKHQIVDLGVLPQFLKQLGIFLAPNGWIHHDGLTSVVSVIMRCAPN